MSDLYNHIAAGHGPLQTLMMRLPGYTGYQEATDRRAADRMMRDHVVGALKEQLNALIQLERTVLNSPGGLGHMSQMHDVQAQLRTFIDRISAAMPGYAGFFDAVKIGPAELQKLYDFDAKLIDYADQFKQKIADLQTAVTSKEGLDAAITALNTLTGQANAEYAQREHVITDIR